MDALERLEIVVRGELVKRKKLFERAFATHGRFHVQELDDQISMLDWVIAHIDMIRRNAFPMSDELVLKMYGPTKNE
jgi:hypothetical protein